MHLDLGVGHLGLRFIVIPHDNCSKIQRELQNASEPKQNGDLNVFCFFLKCINTYMYDVSVAFSLKYPVMNSLVIVELKMHSL